MQRNIHPVAAIGVIVVLAGILTWIVWVTAMKVDTNFGQNGGAGYWADPAEPKMCSAEAMRCPDGSYVGRRGPSCEFAPCPSTESNIRVCPDGTRVSCSEPGCTPPRCSGSGEESSQSVPGTNR